MEESEKEERELLFQGSFINCKGKWRKNLDSLYMMG
jgi:hypothetical protein